MHPSSSGAAAAGSARRWHTSWEALGSGVTPGAVQLTPPPVLVLLVPRSDKKRAQLLEQRRAVGPPVVVVLLPLSGAVDVQRLWGGLLAACDSGVAAKGGSDAGMETDAGEAVARPLLPHTLSLAERRKVRFTFLPPPANREDLLAVVELGKAAEVSAGRGVGARGGVGAGGAQQAWQQRRGFCTLHLCEQALALQQFACCVWPLVSLSRPAPAPQVILLALPGDERVEAVDQEGQAALSVLRALGMPTLVGLVQAPAAPGSKNALKERSAAKKHAGAAFAEHVSALPGCGCCRCAIGAGWVSEGSSLAGAPDQWVLTAC